MSSTISLLALHGWRTNKEILTRQMQPLTSALHRMGYTLDLHVINAPHIASGPPEESVTKVFGPQQTFEWWDTNKTVDDVDEASTEAVVYTYDGIEDSIQFIEDYISKKQQVFDIVVGFSQGSALLGVLNALYSTQKLHEAATSTVMPWKVSIHVSGNIPRAPNYNYLVKNAAPIKIPSIFLLGQSDFLLPYAKDLALQYENPVIHNFEEGHRFPSEKAFNYNILAKQIRDTIN